MSCVWCEVVDLRQSGETFVLCAMRILQRDSFDVVNLRSAASLLLAADVASHVSRSDWNANFFRHVVDPL